MDNLNKCSREKCPYYTEGCVMAFRQDSCSYYTPFNLISNESSKTTNNDETRFAEPVDYADLINNVEKFVKVRESIEGPIDEKSLLKAGQTLRELAIKSQVSIKELEEGINEFLKAIGE